MSFTPTAALLLFGLFQSTIMLFLIFKNRDWRQPQNKLLMLILVVAGLSLVPTFLGNTGLIETNDYLRFIPLNLVIFIFPLLYLYFESIRKVNFKIDSKRIGHFIIPVIFTLYYVIVWVGSLFVAIQDKGNLLSKLAYFEVQSAYYFVLLCQAIAYTTLSLLELKKNGRVQLSKDNLKYRNWLIYLFLFFFAGALFELTSTLIGRIYGYWRSSPLDDWLGFSLTMAVKIYNAVLLYVISLVGYVTYSTFRSTKMGFDKTVIERQLKNILHKMETEKPYLNKDFSLSTFSKQLQVTPAVLSNLLNTHLNVTFNDFANKFRVDEVKDKIQNGAYTNFTIESIAADSGFKSKTTFYRAFYKFTSQTPKTYIGQVSDKKKVS
ncbi:hypothetical protein MTsPCn5_15470 [Croceitalea sp. MTPC5]|uniref:helix-turn-helix domain-containing protein n=1 Tax=Croceitalea sp. MTPC5 TaxID=3056565 RepID=UPI002B3E5342|nr:hypothetical protein MTsPCn5_15470 [Croceitalea sp. MTPC5]